MALEHDLGGLMCRKVAVLIPPKADVPHKSMHVKVLLRCESCAKALLGQMSDVLSYTLVSRL